MNRKLVKKRVVRLERKPFDQCKVGDLTVAEVKKLGLYPKRTEIFCELEEYRESDLLKRFYRISHYYDFQRNEVETPQPAHKLSLGIRGAYKYNITDWGLGKTPILRSCTDGYYYFYGYVEDLNNRDAQIKARLDLKEFHNRLDSHAKPHKKAYF